MKIQTLTWVFLFAFPVLAWAIEDQDFFNIYDLEVDGKFKFHIVEDLNNDQKPDVILIHEGVDKERLISIFYQHDDGFHKDADQTWEFDNRVILFDIGDVSKDSKKEIVCILKDGIYYYQLENGKFNQSIHKLLDTGSIFVVPNKDSISSWNFVRYINDDQIDDLFIPLFDSYGIFYKNETGNYEFNSKITVPLTAELSDSRQANRIGDFASVRYTTATFLFKDYNQDNRSDIIALDEDKLFVFFQGENGGFSNDSGQHKIINIIENKKNLQISIGVKNEKEQLKINKIADINNDGLFDIIAQKMDTQASMLDPTSQLQIYLGKKSDSNTGAIFDKTPDQIIVCEGMQLGSELKDLNNDNNFDLIVPSVKLGVLKIVKMLLMRRATFEVLIYNSDSSGKYSSTPDFKTDLSIEFSYSGGATVPVNDFNDYNGDGQTDILTCRSNKELNIYFGSSGSLFTKQKPDVEFKIPLPQNGSGITPVSLNDDNKMDLIIDYSDQTVEKDVEKTQLKILITK